MIVHLRRILVLVLLLVACILLPFLPGGHDGFAVTLSTMAQLMSVVGLLLMPIAVPWLIYEFRKRPARSSAEATRDRGYYFAVASLVTSLIVGAVVVMGGAASLGVSFGIAVLALWVYGVSRLWSGVRRLKDAAPGRFNPAPLYLVIIPIVGAICHFSFLGRAIEFSRQRAIDNSAELIREIEAYGQTHGRYPVSLQALHGDYKPSVTGIERFHYEPNGKAYNIYFEQFSDRLGTREIVMFNKLDEHAFAAHDSDRLLWTSAQLAARRGYYAVNDGPSPHWKYFWFD